MYKRSFFFSTIELIFTMLHNIWYVGTFCQMKIPETFDSFKRKAMMLILPILSFMYFEENLMQSHICNENNVQQNYRFYFSWFNIIDQFWFLKKCLNLSWKINIIWFYSSFHLWIPIYRHNFKAIYLLCLTKCFPKPPIIIHQMLVSS